MINLLKYQFDPGEGGGENVQEDENLKFLLDFNKQQEAETLTDDASLTDEQKAAKQKEIEKKDENFSLFLDDKKTGTEDESVEVNDFKGLAKEVMQNIFGENIDLTEDNYESFEKLIKEAVDKKITSEKDTLTKSFDPTKEHFNSDELQLAYKIHKESDGKISMAEALTPLARFDHALKQADESKAGGYMIHTDKISQQAAEDFINAETEEEKALQMLIVVEKLTPDKAQEKLNEWKTDSPSKVTSRAEEYDAYIKSKAGKYDDQITTSRDVYKTEIEAKKEGIRKDTFTTIERTFNEENNKIQTAIKSIPKLMNIFEISDADKNISIDEIKSFREKFKNDVNFAAKHILLEKHENKMIAAIKRSAIKEKIGDDVYVPRRANTSVTSTQSEMNDAQKLLELAYQ